MGWTSEIVVLALTVAGLAVCWIGLIALRLASKVGAERRDEPRHARPPDTAPVADCLEDGDGPAVRLFKPRA